MREYKYKNDAYGNPLSEQDMKPVEDESLRSRRRPMDCSEEFADFESASEDKDKLAYMDSPLAVKEARKPQTPPGDKLFKFVSFAEAFRAEGGRNEEMVWDGWIPAGCVGLLTAQPGVGKGWFALEIANVLTNDRAFWMDGQERKQTGKQNVLYLDFEDTIDEWQRRANCLGIDKDYISVLLEESKDGFTIENDDFLKQLEAYISAKSVKLVFIDSCNEATPNIDENNSKDVQRVLSPIRNIAKRTGCTFIIIHHNDKLDKGYRGSTAWAGTSRFIIQLTADDSGRIEAKSKKLNRKKSQTFLSFRIEDADENDVELVFTSGHISPLGNIKKLSRKEQMTDWLIQSFMKSVSLPLDSIRQACEEKGWDYSYMNQVATEWGITKAQKHKIWYLESRPVGFPEQCLIYNNTLLPKD